MPPHNRSQVRLCTFGGVLPGLEYQNCMILCHAEIVGGCHRRFGRRPLNCDRVLPCKFQCERASHLKGILALALLRLIASFKGLVIVIRFPPLMPRRV